MKKKLLMSLLGISLLITSCNNTNSNKVDIDPSSSEEPSSPTNPSEETTGSDSEIDIDAIGKEYANLLRNYTPLEKDPTKTINNIQFEEFLDQTFKNSISESYIFMHSNVTDYKTLGLTKPKVSLGEIKYNDLDKINEYIDDLKKLQSYDYSTLSYRQQYDYDMYQYSLYETIADRAYCKYDLPFSESNDVVSNLVTLLTDFTFYDQESIDDYIILIDDVDRYLKDYEEYINKQADDGIYHTNDSIDYTNDYIATFTSLIEDNAIIKAFTNSMAKIDYISENEKEEYISKVTHYVINEVLPEFNNLSNVLETQRDKATLSGALIDYDKTYAEVQFMLASSSNKEVLDLYKDLASVESMLLQDYVLENYNKMPDAYSLVSDTFGTDYENYLDALKEMAHKTNYYPDLGEAKYDVDLIDASSASSSVLAYYWQAPLDNLNQNIIRVNPNTMNDDVIQTYTTLAHEGFPGHLYQHIYFLKQNPHPFRETQSFGGYVEGYAVRAQHDALEFLLDDEGLANFLFFNTSSYFIEYSLIDIGVNYLGWDAEETELFLTDVLGYKEGYGETFHNFLISNATGYCSYGMGYAEMTLLRNKAKNALKDKFDLLEFNKAILTNGPLPFVLLEQAVDYYILDHQ